MARTNIPVSTRLRAGITLTFTAVALADGGKFDNSSQSRTLVVKNASGGSLTFTPVFGKSLDGKTPTADAVTVANGTTRYMAAYPSDYNQQSGADANYVYFAVSADGLEFALLDT